MTFFQFFYCKAYKYYNVGNKSDLTLRGSAIIGMSALQFTNVFSLIIILDSLLDGALFFNKWISLGLIVLIGVYNFYRINKEKSDRLRQEMLELSPEKNKVMLFWVRMYIFLSILFVILVFVYGKRGILD